MALAFLSPAVARAQTAPPSEQAEGGGFWLLLGGASTALRGDCQECEESSGYLHAGSFLAQAGFRLNSRVDAGAEVFWVPAQTAAGNDVRSTFIEAAVNFRPWASSGFFVRGGMGMGFVRNWVVGPPGAELPYTAKALALSYATGWTFRHTKRVGLQVFGSQHVAALGDLQTTNSHVENVVGNFWSVGAAVVIR
jgi:hypothetical protein